MWWEFSLGRASRSLRADLPIGVHMHREPFALTAEGAALHSVEHVACDVQPPFFLATGRFPFGAVEHVQVLQSLQIILEDSGVSYRRCTRSETLCRVAKLAERTF